MYSLEDGQAFQPGRVAPFGHPRIVDRVHLPAAFRRFLRPSSSLYAKTFAIRSCSFNHFTSYLRTVNYFSVNMHLHANLFFLVNLLLSQLFRKTFLDNILIS